MALSKVPYIRWAKYEGLMGTHRLTASATPAADWKDIGLDPQTLALTEYTPYGPDEVYQQLNSDWGIDPAGIVLGASASHAHFCFGASIVPMGGKIIYETPGYLPLLDALSLLGVERIPIARRFEEEYRLDTDALQEQVIKEQADLVMLTHLHNPSGVAFGDEEIRGLVEVAEKTGCHILIDEMYRGFLDPDPGPLCRFHPKIVSVWGINKVHGISQVRFGWGCATAELADQARRIFDSTTLHTSCLTDQVARAAMNHLDHLQQRGRKFASEGWEIFSNWARDFDLQLVKPAGGLVCFPKVPQEIAKSGFEFREVCMQRDLNLTPGEFFGAADHVRIGFGLPAQDLHKALEVLTTILTDPTLRRSHP